MNLDGVSFGVALKGMASVLKGVASVIEDCTGKGFSCSQDIYNVSWLPVT